MDVSNGNVTLAEINYVFRTWFKSNLRKIQGPHRKNHNSAEFVSDSNAEIAESP